MNFNKNIQALLEILNIYYNILLSTYWGWEALRHQTAALKLNDEGDFCDFVLYKARSAHL